MLRILGHPHGFQRKKQPGRPRTDVTVSFSAGRGDRDRKGVTMAFIDIQADVNVPDGMRWLVPEQSYGLSAPCLNRFDLLRSDLSCHHVMIAQAISGVSLLRRIACLISAKSADISLAYAENINHNIRI